MARQWVPLMLLALILLVVAAPGAGIGADLADQAPAVWIADASEVLKLRAPDAQLMVEIRGADGSVERVPMALALRRGIVIDALDGAL